MCVIKQAHTHTQTHGLPTVEPTACKHMPACTYITNSRVVNRHLGSVLASFSRRLLFRWRCTLHKMRPHERTSAERSPFVSNASANEQKPSGRRRCQLSRSVLSLVDVCRRCCRRRHHRVGALSAHQSSSILFCMAIGCMAMRIILYMVVVGIIMYVANM